MTEDERTLVVAALKNAVDELIRTMEKGLIPGSGAEIAYARQGAREMLDVAAVEGGIKELPGPPSAPGPVKFGAGGHAAQVILTAMKIDPEIRSAAVIRYSPEIIGIIEDLLLETCSFDRASEPPGTRTMDWGVAFCCRTGVPDVIFDRGAPGKEPCVRILGQDPGEVAAIIARISTRYRITQEHAFREPGSR